MAKLSLRKATSAFLATCIAAALVKAETGVLYSTKTATSDLHWTLHPKYGAWEELSSIDVNGDVIRSYQVCQINTDTEQNNWIRSPFIPAQQARRIYLDIEYSVMKCPGCRETFSIYYYPAMSADVASSTFPLWREDSFTRIDTVAAGKRYDGVGSNGAGINKKTLVIGPLSRPGFYLAVQDQGACMALVSVKLYYHFCDRTESGFAVFPRTVSGGEVTSLVAVEGECVDDAIPVSGTAESPRYHCNSNGEWTVRTGGCQCKPGYAASADTNRCAACSVGRYKFEAGNGTCRRCPAHSVAPQPAAVSCSCQAGFFKALADSVDLPCTQPPSAPRNLQYKLTTGGDGERDVTHKGQSSVDVTLTWSKPSDSGGRSDLYYSVNCEECDDAYTRCRHCERVLYKPPMRHHVTGTRMQVTQLSPFSFYRFTVSALNEVSGLSHQTPPSQQVQVSTGEIVPSRVESVRARDSDAHSVRLWWDTPRRPNGSIVDYELRLQRMPDATGGASLKLQEPIVVRSHARNATVTGLDEAATYQVKIRARTSAGFGQFSQPEVFQTAPAATQAGGGIPIWGLVAGAVGVLALVAVAAFVTLRRRRRSVKRDAEEARARDKAVDNRGDREHLMTSSGLAGRGGTTARKTYVDYRDPHQSVKEIAREIDVGKIKIESVIGQGEFGEVCRGAIVESRKRKPIPVAVKRLKHGASLIDQTNFLREACTMAQFYDPNIVQLKGVVTKSMPAMILTEFMENGSLDKFLQRRHGELTLVELLKMLRGIASGMKYLAQMKFVHRDLAARNILVDSQLQCKVSDFGLSRTLENNPNATYTTQGGKIALRWTAPECIRFRKFTSASDVWSYGIVMWEVTSYGEKPYWDMSNDDVTEVIEDGYRLPAPQDCPECLHNMMLQCWTYEARNRPTFVQLRNQLHQLVQQPSLLSTNTSTREDSQPADSTHPLLKPDSPNSLQDVSTLDEWLDMVKLGKYRGSFYQHGISDLQTLSNISTSDLERLGIASPAHRTRLQSGLDTLRRHLTSDRSDVDRVADVPGIDDPSHAAMTMRTSASPAACPVPVHSNTMPHQASSSSRDIAVAVV